VRRRYEREVATALSLNHPNIVRVYEAGQHEGRHYLAMEFIDGIDLARLGKEYRPLAIPEACEYVRQTALGLQHAHERGFVHRDIKPSNIIVAGERHLPQAVEPAVAKILDMGLARAVGVAEEGGEPLDLTRDGVVVGTPDYMAPEQAKNSRNVDNRADLYSLGCTFYFLLTGRPPFAEGTAIEKILKHQLDPVPPVRQWRPDVPAAVEEILLHLLAKRPEDRPASALEVAQALEPWCRYPFTLHPASMAVRQSSHSGSSRQMPTPTETEPALQGRTDPQIGPPPPGSDWPNPASGRSPAGVNLPPTAPTPVMVSLPSATSLPTCASDRSNKHQFEHTPPPLPVASSICPSEPSTARLQTPELPSLSPRLSPPAPLVQPTLVLVLTVSVLLSLLLLAGLWLA
ncbi:MAG: protein kinase, partial [Gemmataceae bacterium]|nr:protein kinase [Gemmataceae bacterium]